MNLAKPLPFTVRFFVGASYNYPSDKVLTIYYMGYHFGHTWLMAEDYPSHSGEWTFNRGSVAIRHRFYPTVYFHKTLEDLLAHLEATFPDVMP